jgi:MoaA/NifB/PqqE/SkfB family radical SAM enzyme
MAIKKRIFSTALNSVISNRLIRSIAAKQFDKYLKDAFLNAKSNALPSMLEKRYQFLSAMLNCVKNNLDKGYISTDAMKKMAKVFIGDSIKGDRLEKVNDVRQNFFDKYGEYPPSFCVLSPTQACNLRCTGCYAVSDETTKPRLSYETVRKVVKDTHDILGSKFMTISGGEPFLYKDSGKTLIDIFEEFNDMLFLVYTNGTLINKNLANKLLELGNVTPAISVEGMERHTDERRGEGVHKQILDAMRILREAGVPFGISATATSKNVDVLLSEEFYDYYFGDLGVSYMWQFQMMPIGRGKEIIDLMITPKQRVELYHVWKKLLAEKKYCVADFWNSGALTEGCLAYGRWGGYFYVDWNGNIMPCVFVPYYQDNVKDLFAKGKTLADGLFSKLMRNGRKWQHQYGLDNAEHRGNILMPCSIKDHFDNFKKNILPAEAIAENPEAEAIRTDQKYHDFLIEYDRQLAELTEKIWQEEYLGIDVGAEEDI